MKKVYNFLYNEFLECEGANGMEWIEVSVKATHEATEAIADLLQGVNVGSDSGANGGVVIEDPILVNELRENGNWDYCGIPEQKNTEVVIITVYLADDCEAKEKLNEIESGIKIIEERIGKCTFGSTQFRKVSEHDWENEWKQYFHTTRVGENFVIKPTWEDYDVKENDKIINIDPGMAFGTGTHATTCMCIEHIENIVNEDSKVFDVGTGSGILAIAAALMNAKEIKAIDIDATAVRVAKENVELNEFSTKIDVKQGDLLNGTDGKADVIIANIIADVIIMLLPDIPKKLKTNGILLASGIIDDRLEDVKKAAKKYGMFIEKITTQNDWAAILMRKEE